MVFAILSINLYIWPKRKMIMVCKRFFLIAFSLLIVQSAFSAEYLLKFVDTNKGLRAFVESYFSAEEILGNVSERIILINITEDKAKELEFLFPRIILEENQKVFLLDVGTFSNTQTVGWNLELISAIELHKKGILGTGIKVAVLDTGIDYNHSDLANNYKGGFDFVNNDSDPKDDHGHGTWVSGVIAAENNSFGVLGISPEAEIYALKVLNSQGYGFVSDIVKAVDWCIKNNISVISMSFGSDEFSQILKDSMDEAYSKGILLVASAGNSGFSSGKSTVNYPAAFSSVIAVGAIDRNKNVADFSSRGPELELVAPGVSINTTSPNNIYLTFSGTSASAPHVAGAAALLLSYKKMRNSELRELLRKAADDLGDPGFDIHYGYGLLNVSAAYNLLNSDSQNFGLKLNELEERISSLENRTLLLENRTSLIENLLNLIKSAICSLGNFSFCPSSGLDCSDECSVSTCESNQKAIICGNFDSDSCLEKKEVFCSENETCSEGRCVQKNCRKERICELKSCLAQCRGNQTCCTSFMGCTFKTIAGIGICTGNFELCEEREVC
jgi:subtilisin